MKKLTLSCACLENDDEKVTYYTGFATYKVFKIVLNYVEPFIKIHKNTALETCDQILQTLIKLRLNLDYKDLGYRFGINPFSASTYFKNVVTVMFHRFKNLIFWPDRQILLKTMSLSFKESFHGNTTVIIDCFEIRTSYVM